MKSLILTSFLLLSTNVFASKLIVIKNLTNQKINSARVEFTGNELVTHAALFKVSELKGKGKSVQDIRQNTVAQALHAVCSFFDEGVSIRLNTKNEKGSMNAVTEFTESSNVNTDDANYIKIKEAISSVNKIENLELYSGEASGNNTSGTVLGFYDTLNNEIAVFANTNCGSDN